MQHLIFWLEMNCFASLDSASIFWQLKFLAKIPEQILEFYVNCFCIWTSLMQLDLILCAQCQLEKPLFLLCTKDSPCLSKEIVLTLSNISTRKLHHGCLTGFNTLRTMYIFFPVELALKTWKDVIRTCNDSFTNLSVSKHDQLSLRFYYLLLFLVSFVKFCFNLLSLVNVY